MESDIRDGRYIPRFELVVFADPGDLVGSLAEPLVVGGVPRSLVSLAYIANDSLAFLDSPSRGLVVCFGASREKKLCVDPKTGEVIELADDFSGKEWPVNRSLAHFSRCVEGVIGRFPFYSKEESYSGDEIVDAVGLQLRDIIRGVDPGYLGQDSFWEEFVSDVEIGDYFTEEVTPLKT